MNKIKRFLIGLNVVVATVAVATFTAPAAAASEQFCEQDMRCFNYIVCEFRPSEICCPYWPAQCN